MAINIIAYPPGGGGNHLRNLCALDDRFQDQWPWNWVREQRIGLISYDHPARQPGTVHSLPGRNIHQIFVDQITAYPGFDYLLHGHFGELALHANAIRSWPNTKWLVMTIDHDQDRQLLKQRQQRLGYHPYWIDEEQIFLYRPEMYVCFFHAKVDHVCTMSLEQFWQPNIIDNAVLDSVITAFDLCIDVGMAQTLHHKWYQLNFASHNNNPCSEHAIITA